MKNLFLLLVLTALTVGCRNDHPKATITFEKFYNGAQGFVIEFNSDIDFEALYAANKHQKIVRKYLTCSLSDDENFDVEHRLQYDFSGSIELVNVSGGTGKKLYRYASNGNFHENVSSSSSNLLWGKSLEPLLVHKKAIPCRVIMTVYLSSPYYSNVMLVPTDVINVAARE